jgi:hypothetical protein
MKFFKFLLCLSFLTTPLFSEHWDNRKEGDIVQIINFEYQGIPVGTQLPVYRIQSNENAEWLQVWYGTDNKSLGRSQENINWYFVTDGNKDIIRSLGFLTGLVFVSIFALAWNSRTV